MDTMQKTPLKIRVFIVKWLAIAVFACIALTTFANSLFLANRFMNLQDSCVTVQAQIIRVEVVEDTEGSDTYNTIMRYEYQGIQYTDKYRNYSSRKEAEAMINQIVAIQLDPDSPSENMDEIRSDAKAHLAIAVGLFGICLWIAGVRQRQDYVQVYGWYREAVKKDMIRYILCKSRFYVILIPLAVHYSVKFTFSNVYGFSIADLIGAVAVLLSVRFMMIFIRRLRMVSHDQFYMSRDSFVSKREDSDSDGSSYYITYRNGTRTWEKAVSYRVFDHANPGDVLETAYLEGEKKPLLSFSSKTGSF